MEGIIAVTGLFALAPLIIWAISHYKYKTQKAHAEVLTAITNKGETLTPEIIESLGVQKKPKNHDLRRGVILIALAIATFVMANFVPEIEAQDGLTGLAMFPLFIGIAYTGLWVLVSRKDN